MLLWNLRTGALAGPALIPPANDGDQIGGAVVGISFSPDGKYLAESEMSGRDILFAQISPDDTSLVVGIAGGPIMVHPLDLTVLEDQACQIVQRNLTRQEWSDLIGTQNDAYIAICPHYPAP